MRVALYIVIFLAAAAGLFLLATAVPVHYDAVDPRVLEVAGRGTEGVVERAEFLVQDERPGPALKLRHYLASQGAETGILDEALRNLLAREPIYRKSGGADPFFLAFLQARDSQAVPLSDADGDSVATEYPVADLLLPNPSRQWVQGRLQASSHGIVRSVMATLDLKGLTRFSPRGTAAGVPWETAVLTMAMCAQSGYIQPQCGRELQSISMRAGGGNPAAIRELESLYLGMLSLANRLNFQQLADLIGTVHSLDALPRLGTVARVRPEWEGTVYTAVLLSGDATEVLDYLDHHGATAIDGLRYALAHGVGALEELVRRDKPLFSPPPFLARVGYGWEDLMQNEWPARLVWHHAGAAFLLKLGAFFLAGIFFLFALLRLATWPALRYAAKLADAEHRPVDLGSVRGSWLAVLRNTMGGLVFAVIAWVAVEPSILSSLQAARAELRLDPIADNPIISTFTTDPMITENLDLVTLLVLLIFFVIQLFVYVLCLIKLAEIRRVEASATLKLELLNNEENLFDTGLYVGLGGTVLSLITVTLGLVQASLMAAYASTFFGIIFVAILKILHVRPFRKQLILLSQQT